MFAAAARSERHRELLRAVVDDDVIRVTTLALGHTLTLTLTLFGHSPNPSPNPNPHPRPQPYPRLNPHPTQVMLPNVKVAAPGVQQVKNKIKAEKKAAATQKKANKAAAAELD
eukprot:scaffold54551_cov39-Phaeocystis_antarctica.AAC.2